MLEWNNVLALQGDNNGHTPLHFAATTVPGNQKIRSQVLKANAEALYQPDHNGSFPVHMAASVGATSVVSEFIENTPNCAGLRDARKMTFLHVAVDNKKISTVSYACKNGTLSWIFNMQDKNGNTAVHLAAQAGSVKIFCCLFRNRQVQLNLTNKKGETPLDIAYQNIPKGLHAYMHSEARILSLLQYAGAKRGIRHQDYLEKNNIVQKNQGEIDEMGKVKDAPQSLCIGSVLIATVTFGAAFAMPGGYRADDHTNGGTPTLAGRYGFDAFTLANGLAFTCSTMATISLMSSGSPIRHPRSRIEHLRIAYYLMSVSVTSLVAAFALATYTILAPLAHKTAIGLCILSSLILLY
uniref:PGG domain-containing protein n=1 Tax=Triticum urartu TaxID=4572 RepID=A0A8R7UWA8_TRIUA